MRREAPPVNLKALAIAEGKVMYSRWYWTMTYLQRAEYILKEVDAETRKKIKKANKRAARGV